MSRRLVLAIALVVLACPAHAQVFKCVDAVGRTTYQQSPCAKNEKGTKVELATDNGESKDSAALEAQWSAAAKEGRIVPGMSKRFVQNAYGIPTEVRPGSTADRASEIWSYKNPGGSSRRIGFLDGRVSWERADDASTEPPMADEPGDTQARRETPAVAARRTIAPGGDCGQIFGAAGKPDRSEGVQIAAAGPGGKTVQAPAMRHIYDDDGSGTRNMAFTCLGNIVTDVERPAR